MAATHAYVARCQAGHFVGVIVDNPEHSTNTTSQVASWMKRGRTIDRLPIDDARKTINFEEGVGCEFCQPRRVKKTKQGALL